MYKNCIHDYFSRACRVACAIAISVFGIELQATAQSTSKDLSFEVATVKPVLMGASHPFNPQHFGAHVTPAGASYWTMTVGNLIDYAYGIDPDQSKAQHGRRAIALTLRPNSPKEPTGKTTGRCYKLF